MQVIAIFDLSSFTKLAMKVVGSRLDQLAEKLNDAYEKMIHFVEESHGDILSFAGDALICAFVPDNEAAESKSALYAIKCAKTIVNKLFRPVEEFESLKVKVSQSVVSVCSLGKRKEKKRKEKTQAANTTFTFTFL